MNAQKITISQLPELTGTVEDSYMLPIDDGELTYKVSVEHFEEAASGTARQYAEAAADSATAAAGSAHDAELIATEIAGDIAAATQAANDARGAATRAAGSADAAAAADVQAQRAASAASTSANAASLSASEASGYKTAAQSEADRAKSWADYPGQTGSGDATHNAHFYADQAAAAIAGVASWNSRSGNVMPQEGDYNLDMLGDVALNNPSDGDSLEYDSMSQIWGTGPKKMNHDGSNAAASVEFGGTFSVGENVKAFGDGSVAFGKGDDYKSSSATYVQDSGTLSQALQEGDTEVKFDDEYGISSSYIHRICKVLVPQGSPMYGYCANETTIILEQPSTVAMESGTVVTVWIFSGVNTVANGSCAFARGYGAIADGDGAHSDGYVSRALHANSFATGLLTQTGAANQFVAGKYNTGSADTVFEVGNGTTDIDRSNAFEVYGDGKVSNDNGETKIDISLTGIVTSAVSASIGASQCTINDSAIKSTSLIDVYCETASGKPVVLDHVTVSTGSAVLYFDSGLAEAASFKLIVK